MDGAPRHVRLFVALSALLLAVMLVSIPLFVAAQKSPFKDGVEIDIEPEKPNPSKEKEADSAVGGAFDTVDGNIATSTSLFRGMFMHLLLGGATIAGDDIVEVGTELNTKHEVMQRMGKIMFELLMPLYALLILLTGIYFVYGPISPNVRQQTKSQLQKLLIGIIVCGLSFPIYDMLLMFDNEVVRQILTVGGVGGRWDPVTGFMVNAAPGVILGGAIIGLIIALTFGVGLALIFPLVCGLFAIVLMPFVVLAMRWILVLVYGIAFPFTIFCQSFDFTKGLGTKLMKQTLTWIFLPVPMAVFVVLAMHITEGPAGLLPGNAIAGLAAFALIGLSPMMMTSMLNIMGAEMISVGQTMNNSKLVFIGGVMQGKSAASLTDAAFQTGRSMSGSLGPRESADAYDVPEAGKGAPGVADAGRPSEEAVRAQRMREAAAGGTQQPYVYGGATREHGGPGDTGGVFAKGISLKESVARFTFGDLVPVGTKREHMTGKQYFGLKYAIAKQQGRGLAMAYWTARGLLSNVSPRNLMPAAGYFLKGAIRQTFPAGGIGKSLSAIADRMTGWPEKDPATGRTEWNYGWRSYRGIRTDAARSAAALAKGAEKKGAPAPLKAAIAATGLALPLALLTMPIAGGVGLGILAVVGVGTMVGARIMAPIGEAMAQDEETDKKLTTQKDEDTQKTYRERLNEARGNPTEEDKLKDELWDGMDDKQKARFRTGTSEAGAKDRAFQYYGGRLAASQEPEGVSREARDVALGGRGEKVLDDDVVAARGARDTAVTDRDSKHPQRMMEDNIDAQGKADAESEFTTRRQQEIRNNDQKWIDYKRNRFPTTPPSPQQLQDMMRKYPDFNDNANLTDDARKKLIDAKVQGNQAAYAQRYQTSGQQARDMATYQAAAQNVEAKEGDVKTAEEARRLAGDAGNVAWSAAMRNWGVEGDRERWLKEARARMASTPEGQAALEKYGENSRRVEEYAMMLAYTEGGGRDAAAGRSTEMARHQGDAAWSMLSENERYDLLLSTTLALHNNGYLAAEGMGLTDEQVTRLQQINGITDSGERARRFRDFLGGKGQRDAELALTETGLTLEPGQRDFVGRQGQLDYLEEQAKANAWEGMSGRSEVQALAMDMAADKQLAEGQKDGSVRRQEREERDKAFERRRQRLMAWGTRSPREQEKYRAIATGGIKEPGQVTLRDEEKAMETAFMDPNNYLIAEHGKLAAAVNPFLWGVQAGAADGASRGQRLGAKKWLKRAAGIAVLGIPFAAGYIAGKDKADNPDTSAYAEVKGRKWRELEGDRNYVVDAINTRVVNQSSLKTYSFEKDGVYESDNLAGTNRRKLGKAEADAVTSWYNDKLRPDGERRGRDAAIWDTTDSQGRHSPVDRQQMREFITHGVDPAVGDGLYSRLMGTGSPTVFDRAGQAVSVRDWADSIASMQREVDVAEDFERSGLDLQSFKAQYPTSNISQDYVSHVQTLQEDPEAHNSPDRINEQKVALGRKIESSGLLSREERARFGFGGSGVEDDRACARLADDLIARRVRGDPT